MKQAKEIMGMPIVVEIIGEVAPELFDKVFDYFRTVDEQFSTYKPTSEISRINAGILAVADASPLTKQILALCEDTKEQTDGFFDIRKPDGKIDPSGLVKGWAIQHAAEIIKAAGVQNFYVEAGGDIQVSGHNADGKPWQVGIRSPFDPTQIIKIIELTNGGVATSGNYMRGNHIYSPKTNQPVAETLVSITVVGPNIYEADRFATAAFAMGDAGIYFIEKQLTLESYAIYADGIGTETTGFSKLQPTHA